jgi:hypothetical protein
MNADGCVPGVNYLAVEEVWQHSGAKGSERLVLISIARFLNAERKAWPSHASVESLTGLSESAISNCLGRLENAERLKIKYRKNKGETNLYTLPRYQPTRDTRGGLGDGEPTRETRDKLPSRLVQREESKKNEKQRTVSKGSLSRETRGGSNDVISLPGDVTTDERTLGLSLMIADAMIEHRGKKPRYRNDAESRDWINGTAKLGRGMTPGEQKLAERYLGDVLDHVVTSEQWQHVKMPSELHVFWKDIRQSMPDGGRPPEKLRDDDHDRRHPTFSVPSTDETKAATEYAATMWRKHLERVAENEAAA